MKKGQKAPKLPQAEIVNVVATADLHQPIDLNAVAEIRGVFYDFSVYQCAYLKDGETNGKVSIFHSGKMISVGTKNEQRAFQDLAHAAFVLQQAQVIDKADMVPMIRNIVAIADFGKTIDLEELSLSTENTIYEPSQFPGAIHRLTIFPRTTVLIFASGKIVIAGAKRADVLDKIISYVANLLESKTDTIR